MNDDIKNQLINGYLQINLTNLFSILILVLGTIIVLISGIILIKLENQTIIINTQKKESKIIPEEIIINLIPQPENRV